MLVKPDHSYVRGATISPCGRYRSHLSRVWNPNKPYALFVMLNPSIADALVDDPTIRRCVGFARSWRFGGAVVVNLFQLRATDPKVLLQTDEKNPDICDEVIWGAMRKAGVIVAAWGALHPKLAYRAFQFHRLAQKQGGAVKCFGLTKGAWPRHPLYLPSDAQLQPYNW